MPTTPPDATERLNEILLAYLEAASAGWAPARDVFLASYPQYQTDLREFLTSRAVVERLATPLREQLLPETLVPLGADGDALGQLGDFRLLREIGRGGMGVVYEAEQLSLRRQVALKVLPFAAALDSRQLQRFRNESLAAANLRHDHIVPVFAVGAERGIHFYAMQLIDGQSLANLIVQLKNDNPVSPEVPSTEETQPYLQDAARETVASGNRTELAASLAVERSQGRRKYYHWIARLGVDAALALDHAHERGIVHRDIKPANLLLDSSGQIWVTDFGLAHVNNDVSLTMTGEILGTLRYASPEQALGRHGVVDHRSDIYSLGATLYELLTLQPLFAGSDRHQLLRMIAEQEPLAPRTVDPRIPRELELILHKALSKEPYERYTTAREFADDLKRFMDDRPILARPPRWNDLALKWARRHSTIVISGTIAVMLSFAALTFATIYSQRAYDREKAKSQEALAHHERADASFRQARRAVEEFSRISEEELAGLPYAENLRKRLLEVSLSYYQDFLQQRVNDPEVRLDLAQTRDRIQQLLADLAVMNGAGRHLLLGSPAVHADLRLTESQRNQARVFLDQIIYQRNTEPRDARQMVLEIKRHEAELATFLSKDQIQRLGQIFLQLRGILAFRDSEVLAELKLTPDQKEKLRSIEQEAFITDLSMMAKVGGPPDGRRGGPGPGGPPGRGPKFPPGKQPIDTILNLLTPDQLARWEALVGPEFLGPRGPYGAYGGGPFGGPHRGGPPRKGDRDDN